MEDLPYEVQVETFNFYHTNTRSAYSCHMKAALGKKVFELKEEAKAKKKSDRGVYTQAVKELIPKLKDAKYNSDPFLAAVQLAKRSYNSYVNPTDEPETKKLKTTFRVRGKTGPKVRCPEVREALYMWVVDVRTAIKARLPRAVFRAMAIKLQDEWIEENPEAAKNYKKVGVNHF